MIASSLLLTKTPPRLLWLFLHFLMKSILMIDLKIHSYQPMMRVIHRHVRIILSRTNAASSLVVSIRMRIMKYFRRSIHKILYILLQIQSLHSILETLRILVWICPNLYTSKLYNTYQFSKLMCSSQFVHIF